MNPDRVRWNEKYQARGRDLPSIPLLRYQGRLRRGRALDVAGGLGENAVLLSLGGWTVTLLELSDVAIARARARARELKADLHIVQGDALSLPFRGPFDTIIVTRFLERRISEELMRLLGRGGTLFCDQPMSGLPDPYCIGPGEFARIFHPLELLVEATEGDHSIFIARKRE